MIKNQEVCRIVIFLLILFAISPGSLGWPASDRDQAQYNVYFSQGQSAYDPRNRAKSQQEAIQDFLAQAIIQAVGAFMSPSQMGSQYGLLQDKFLRNAGHYIQTYQVFSEVPANGLYQVRGQVTVAMDVLKKELVALGLAQEGSRTSASVWQSGESQPTFSSDGPEEPAGTSSAISGDKPELYWAVAEKWGREWHIPNDGRDSDGVFAASALRESQDYGWLLRLPDAESLTIDESGKIPESQVISRAKALGIQKAIVGNAALKEDGDERSVLETTLRILDVSSGRSLGEIHKESDVGESSGQEGAMELASMVMPQIDSLISARPQAASSTPSTQTTPPATKFEPVKGVGEWTLIIQAGRQFAYWKELEQTVRERSKSMRVVSLVMDSQTARVQLDGVDGELLASLQGTKLPGGVQVRIEGRDQETRTLDVSFVRSEAP